MPQAVKKQYVSKAGEWVEVPVGGGGGGTDATVPAGAIMMWMSDAAPTGWQLCDGTLLSRSEHSALFDVIGTRYGGGDGATTFASPNLGGRVPVGLDTEQTEFDTLGNTGGAKTHTLTVDEMPSHAHDMFRKFLKGAIYNGDPEHSYHASDNTSYPSSIDFTGGGQPHNNLQPYITVNYIIKL